MQAMRVGPKMRYYIYCLLLLFWGCVGDEKRIKSANSKDDYYEKCRKLVLSQHEIGRQFDFKVVRKEIDEFSLIYLGTIKTRNGDTLKFLNAINYYGSFEDAKHANGFVYIYVGLNRKVGYYYVGGASGIPSRIEDGNLIFDYMDKSCNQTTEVIFLDSIPKQIFIRFTDRGGDIYTFNAN